MPASTKPTTPTLDYQVVDGAHVLTITTPGGVLTLTSAATGGAATITVGGDTAALDSDAIDSLILWTSRAQFEQEIAAASARREAARNDPGRDSTTKLYVSLGGEVLCTEHIGAAAQAQIEAYPRRKRIETTMTVWERISPDDGYPCETCDRKAKKG